MVSQDFLKCTTSMVPVNVCTILAFKWLLYKSTKIALVRFLSTYIHKMYIGMAFQYFHNCLTWWLQSMNAQYLHLNGLSIFPLKLHQYGFSWCITYKVSIWIASLYFHNCSTSMVPVNVCTILAFKWPLYMSTEVALVWFLSTYIHKMYIGMASPYFLKLFPLDGCGQWMHNICISMASLYFHLKCTGMVSLNIYPQNVHLNVFSIFPQLFPPRWLRSMNAQYLHLNGLSIFPLKLHRYGFS